MKILIELSKKDKEKVDNCHKALFVDVYKLMAKAIKEGKVISDDPILVDETTQRGNDMKW